MNRLSSNRRLLQPKKIWEIEGCYKCALIGTCLTRVELRKLARERIYAVEPGRDDYQLHAHFINLSGQADASGKALHRFLEKKYRPAVRKYRSVSTDLEIQALWNEDLAEGRVDSAWWAVMTHPLASPEFVGRLYAYIHMLSHESTSNYYKDRTLIRNLLAKTAMLEEVLGSERQYFRQKKRQLSLEISALKKEASKQDVMLREQGDLSPKIPQQDERMRHPDMLHQQQLVIVDLRQDNNALSSRVARLAEDLDATEKRLAAALVRIRDLEELRQRLELHGAEQKKELATCVFRSKSATDSVRIRPLIPFQTGRVFRWKAATDSGGIRPPC